MSVPGRALCGQWALALWAAENCKKNDTNLSYMYHDKQQICFRRYDLRVWLSVNVYTHNTVSLENVL